MKMKAHRIRMLFPSALAILLGAGFAAHGLAAERYKPVTMMCGDARATMRCKPSTNCSETVIRLTTAAGKRVVLQKPQGLHRFTGVGLACTSSPNREIFVQVEYGSLPVGCSVCEWFALYDLEGRKLTDNHPAILIDKERAAFGGGEYPNNREFDAMVKKWHLDNPEIEGIAR